MPDMFSFVSRSTRDTGKREAVRRSVGIIEEALSHEETRDLAVKALEMAAIFVEEAGKPRDTPPLDDRETAALRRMGLGAVSARDASPETEIEIARATARGVVQWATIVRDAVPLVELAQRIGVSDARLRQRVADGTLLAIPRPRGRGWLIPNFQLTGEGDLPQLPRVLRSLRRQVSIEALAGFFTTPQEELDGRSPRDWLAAGGDPVPVERIAASL